MSIDVGVIENIQLWSIENITSRNTIIGVR